MHLYALLQRWRFFGEWPEKVAFHSEWMTTDMPLTSPDRTCSVAYRTCIGLGEVVTPTGERLGGVPLYGYPDTTDLFCLGEHIVCGTSESVEIEIKTLGQPSRGEHDLGVIIYSPDAISREDIMQYWSGHIQELVALSVLKFSTAGKSVSPITAHKMSSQNISAMGDLKIKVFHRPIVQVNDIAELMKRFLAMGDRATRANRLRIQIASRRYLTAVSETDIIDRYCDFWECCEFLTIDQVGGGDKAEKVSRALAMITGAQADLIYRHLVQPLYSVRKNIVHDAAEDMRKLQQLVDRLELVAETMLRDALRTPVEPAKVAEMLSHLPNAQRPIVGPDA